MKEALFYSSHNNKVNCNLCRQNCVIKKDSLGFCGVRKNVNNKIYSLNYGRLSSVNVDPIEKKPLFHFLPFTKTFSIGSFGCNFKCGFCQNWEISQHIKDIEKTKPEELIEGVKTPSISYTYNEPTISYEYVYETAKLAKKRDIKNVLVTNGYIEEEPLNKIKNLVSAVNIDFKAFNKDFYAEECKASFDKFLDSLEVWAKTKIWIEFTNLLIPTKNDNKNEIKQMCSFIKDKFGSYAPLHFSSYYPSYKSKIPATSMNAVFSARDIAIEQGLKYVYVGNVGILAGSETLCYNCGDLLVDRGEPSLCFDGKKCPKCGKKQWFVMS